MVGGYSILDMAVWGWARMLPFVLGEGMTDMAIWSQYPNLKRHFDLVSARPAAARALAIKDRHTFKAEFDAEAKRHMFRHIAA